MIGGAQRGDQREARVARAGIVDGKPEAEPTERLDLALERDDVGDGLLLGALERDLLGLEAGLADHVGERARLEVRVEQARRA